mmetsp:Transcript_7225/g.8275  ORF Transcript_7225/g.8275 Transcript_7225/m.8275 type:complete len:915 (+) Transcript_7225:228-2972(+)
MSSDDIKLSKWRRAYLRNLQRNTCYHFWGYIALILLTSVIATQSYEVLYGENDISDPNAPAKIALDSVSFARDMFDTVASEEDSNEQDEFVFAYSWNKNSDILTANNLQAFCEIEKVVFDQTDFDSTIFSCNPEEANQTCVVTLPDVSITAFIYSGMAAMNETFSYDDCYLLNETALTVFKNTIFFPLVALESPQRGLVDSDTTPTLVRSLISISSPTLEDLQEKEKEIEKQLFDLLGMEAGFGSSPYRGDATYKGLDVIFVSDVLVEIEFEGLVPTDFSWILGSILFVAIWMRVYTRSTFLTALCLFYILFSVMVGMFVYKLILNILFFDFIHLLVVFLILGIGADGVFVVVDAWKQSKEFEKDEFNRLAYTYNRSAATVFNTSFTTMFAFAVTGLSALVPISTFGIFAAICIGVNYVFILTVIPATILIWHRRYCNDDDEETESISKIQEAKTEDEPRSFESLVSGNNEPFEKYYVPFVLAHRKKLVAAGIALGALGMFGITNVSQLTKPEQFLPDDHMFTKYIDVLSDSFLGGQEDEFTQITVFWGIDTIERDIFSHYSGVVEDYEDELIFDDAFDPADSAAQAAMISLCETLQNATCTTSDCLGRTTLLLPETVSYQATCSMQDFSDYFEAKEGSPLASNTNETLFYARVREFVEENPSYSNLIGFIGGELKFFASTFRLTLPILAIGPEKEVYEERLEEIMKQYEASAPATAKLVNFASAEFVQRAVEIALVDTVVRGLLITFPVVFAVMIYATRNAYLAFISVLAILFIVMTVLGFVFSVLEWELGIAESIVAIMIVGLSVDYCVHLGHMFTLAGKNEGYKKKIDRFHFAALTMGPTVLAGGATTLGAGVFLFGCQITFFNKMGVLLTMTVCCSLFFSLFFLMPAATLFDFSKDSEEENEKEVKNASL